MDVLLLAVMIQLAGGVGALAWSRSASAATYLGAGSALGGCLLGLAPTLRILIGGAPESIDLAWDATHGAFHVEVDALSAFFLLPVLGLSALAALYGSSYLLASRRGKALGPAWFFFNVFVAGMVMLLCARTALLFLVAWEVMSIAAFCLIALEHDKEEARRAGWFYLIATHLGVIFLFLTFLLLGRHAGSLEFQAFRAMPPLAPAASGLVFVLALVGFGTKAGLVPLHVWLPEAHPAAPSHVSALMSGVMIKMGFYGILRVLTFVGPPVPWWGATLAGVGLLTSLVGITLAMQQRDMKRVLAYSSIENMGLIALALGVGLWGWASGLPVVAVLGMTAGLLHIWNHALIKGLLFFAAGSVVHAAGAKDIEKLGGLMKLMPWTGSAMLLGALAIAALPPLNGFVSKWLLYLGLMRSGLSADSGAALSALLAIGVVALIGGLTALAFVRLAGAVLLGAPRSETAVHAHESSPWMIAPMHILVLLCLTAALLPQAMADLTLGALDQLLGADASRTWLVLQESDAPLAVVGDLHAWTLLAALAVGATLLALTRGSWRNQEPTWGCGYARPTPRMQYTGRSFVEMIAEHLVPRCLRARTRRQAPFGLFPAPGSFDSDGADPLSERVYEPFLRRWADRCARLRILQQGKIHVYLVYIMVMVVLALAWVPLRTRWWGTP